MTAVVEPDQELLIESTPLEEAPLQEEEPLTLTRSIAPINEVNEGKSIRQSNEKSSDASALR